MYSPQAFGFAALFLSRGASLSVIATLRLDLAAVLPKSDAQAVMLVRLILVQSLVICGVLTVLVALVGSQLQTALGSGQSNWLWLLGPMCAFQAMVQASIALATRVGRFGVITLLNLAVSAAFVVFGLSLWLAEIRLDGLVIARLLAPLMAVGLALSLGLFRPMGRRGSRLTWWRAKGLYRRYHQFLIYNTPYSFFSSIVADLPILLFSFIHSPATAAYYGLAKTLLRSPTILVSSALSQVMYKEVVDNLGKPRLELTVKRLMWGGLMVGFPAFAFLTVWGDILFATVFGREWDQAGVMAMVLAPSMWLCFQTGWIQRVYEATNSQKLSFQIQIGSDLAVIVGMILTLHFTSGVLPAVVGYSILFSLNNVLYLFGAFHAAHFERRFLVRVLVAAGLGYVTLAMAGALTRQVGLSESLAIATTLGLVAVAYAAIPLAWKRRRWDDQFAKEGLGHDAIDAGGK